MQKWDDIDKIYYRSDFIIKKGSKIKLNILMDKSISEYNKQNLANYINIWPLSTIKGNIRPFKVLTISFSNDAIEAVILYKYKDKEIDELKLLCEDLLFYFNVYDDHILNLEYSKF